MPHSTTNSLELIDVLDNNGNSIGESKSKKQIHKAGDWHRAVHIWILNSKGQLLIQKRSSEKDSYPDMWEVSASGHVSAGESSTVGAIRELGEELGLITGSENLQKLFTIKSQVVLQGGSYHNNEFVDVYLLHSNLSIASLKIQKSEIDTVKFVDKDVLEQLYREKDTTFVPKTTEYYDKLFSSLIKLPD